MSKYEVGYKKPPLHSRFQKGKCSNPKGRGKRKTLTEADAFEKVLNSLAEFRHRGKSKRATRIELAIRRFGAAALEGNVGAADVLLKMREHFKKHGNILPRKMVLVRRMLDPSHLNEKSG
jgi:hypothetical protein